MHFYLYLMLTGVRKMERYLKKQLLIAFCIYVGQMLVGFGLGWTAPVISKLQDPDQTPLPDVITEGQGSWIGSVLYIGTIAGPYISSYLSNVKGRKPCLFLGGIVTAIAFLLLGLASNFVMIIVGRILSGVGTGIIAIVNLVYIGEIASTNIRGILLTATGIFGTLGTLIIYSVGPYVSYAATAYLGMALSLLYIASLFVVPETPVFQVLIGQHEEAKEILHSLGREDEVTKILNTKQEAPKSSRRQEWIEILSIKTNRKATFITLTLCILQQMSGVVAVIFFATSIFELAGSSIEPNMATIIIGITQIFASTITPFFVEKSGRRMLLMLSSAFCSISLAVLGLFFYLDDIRPDSVVDIKWLPLVSLIIFFLSYDFGFGIIPGTLIGEMFSSNVRSTGSTFVSTVAWLIGFGVSTAFGYMLPSIGGGITFWIFAASCALACLFTAIFVPETKGKSLIDIQEMLSK